MSAETALKWRTNNKEKIREDGQRRQAEYRAMLGDIKLALGCTDCGYNLHADALDFDHVVGDKVFNLARGAHRPDKAIQEELAKCEVVCSNCHRIRTAKRRLEEKN